MTIDVRSDTVTKPTSGMRLAISNAEVGDDVLDGDPTTRRLETRTAELLGKERGLFCPTGTMANQIAIWLLAERGTEVLADVNSHIHDLEYAATSALTGAQLRPVSSDGPMMDATALERGFRPCIARRTARHARVLGKHAQQCRWARHSCLGVACDGRCRPRSRLCGASRRRALVERRSATGDKLAQFAECADTVMVSFLEGVGRAGWGGPRA